jgi:ribosomal protein S18 acetylase RimI-like enzyme
MDLRPYQPSDQTGCLAVFDSNCPDFFAAGEREEFANFLASPDGAYFVLDHDGAIAGCGGYAAENPQLASITWTMVRRDLHRNGLGRLLLFAAMKKLTASANVSHVRLHTSPACAAFFEKQGFRVAEVTPDGIAPGMDRVEMLKKLQVCP